MATKATESGFRESKRAVLEAHPGAWCSSFDGGKGWCVYDGQKSPSAKGEFAKFKILGEGDSEQKAWADAEDSLCKVKPSGPMIYVASSRSARERKEMWQKARLERGWRIASGWWLDADWPHPIYPWIRMDRELNVSDGVLLYLTGKDLPEGEALIEVGMALGAGKPVAVVMPERDTSDRGVWREVGAWMTCPGVEAFSELEAARSWLCSDESLKYCLKG